MNGIIKSLSVVRLPVSLFWSFLLHSAGFPHIFCGLGYPVLNGRLVGCCVDQSGACQWQASQSTGKETPPLWPVPTPQASAVFSESALGSAPLGSAWCTREAEVSSAHVHVPSPWSLLLVSLDMWASFPPSPFNLYLFGCSGSQLQQVSSSIIVAGCGI